MRRRAFTLIELLVVIAIIAILAAILFPVFAAAKETAKATQILAQMKQIGTGLYMYATDYDDKCLPWFVRTGLPSNGPFREDLVSWCYNIQPYVKNGTPDRAALVANPAAINIQPKGLLNSPMWTVEKWVRGADEPDCDGPGALNSWLPLRWIHSHYGIGFGILVPGSCTPADPYFFFAGSDVRWKIMDFTETQRPAETIIITDGFTGVIQTNGFGTSMGCESRYMYKGGGNAIFVDSHAKFVKGNNERYLQQDSAGCYFKTYHTIDK
jgi:prepilin-type N-terminal cleavage/methylation domain-containing protein